MNWFERYGIPGLYFVLLVATACYIFGPPCDKDTAIQIFIAALSASLPIGYILVVTSQWLYYKVPCLQVHHKAWKAAKKDADKELPEDEEWWVEARATILGRWKLDEEKIPKGIEKGKWLQEWFTKRFDVLAINSTLILATIIGLLVLIIMCCLRFSQASPLDYYRRWALVAFIGLSILAIAVLVLSNNLLKEQARYVATEYYKDLRKKEAKTQTSSSHNHVNGIPHLER